MALKLTSLCAAAVLAVCAAANAAPSTLGPRPPIPTARPPVAYKPPPKVQFNRESLGPASGVKPAVRTRAYQLIDAQAARGAAPKNYKSHSFANDGRSGSLRLPSTTAAGKTISYRTTYLRPQYAKEPAYKLNARVVTGSDGSAHVSRHYGQKGARAGGRIQ